MWVSRLAVGACASPVAQAPGWATAPSPPGRRCAGLDSEMAPGAGPILARGACIEPLDPVRRPAAPRGVRPGSRFGPFLPPPRRPPRGRGAIGMDSEMAPRTGPVLVEGLVSSPSNAVRRPAAPSGGFAEIDIRALSPPPPPPPRGRGATGVDFMMAIRPGPGLLEGLV